jgi:ubiquinone/menaquinone biosynthesis C-methylase UbiE
VAVSTDAEIDWGKYAKQYDLMCHHNDAYEENVSSLIDFVKSINLNPTSSILDIGAGTGNYLVELSRVLPDAYFTHLDANREMNTIALQKYEDHQLKNVQIVEEKVQRANFSPGAFSLAICVNALYAMNPQELILSKIRSWLAPDGYLYVIDLGRKMDSWDWGRHFLRQAYREKRLLEYLTDAVTRGREVLKQNNMTTVAQETGKYWTHETPHFGRVLQSAGFEVQKLETCYRGYADLAICRPA